MKRFLKIIKRVLISLLILLIMFVAFGAIINQCGAAEKHIAAASVEEEETLSISDMEYKSRVQIPKDNSITNPYYIDFLSVYQNLDLFRSASPKTFYIGYDNIYYDIQCNVEFVFYSQYEAATINRGTRSSSNISNLVLGEKIDYSGNLHSRCFSFTVTNNSSPVIMAFSCQFGNPTVTNLDFTMIFYTGSYIPNYAYNLYKAINGEGYQNGYTAGETAGKEEGYQIGYTAGETAGKEEGYQDGYSAGETAGKEEGYQDGYTAGETAGKEEGYQNGYGAGEIAGKEEGYQNGYEEGQKVATESAYQNGYNQGAADTANDYSLGLLKNLTARVAGSNSVNFSYSIFTKLTSEIKEEHLDFSGFPEYTTNYNRYILSFDLGELVNLQSNSIIFHFNSALPLWTLTTPSGPQTRVEYVGATFSSDKFEYGHYIIFENDILPGCYLVPVQGTENAYAFDSQSFSEVLKALPSGIRTINLLFLAKPDGSDALPTIPNAYDIISSVYCTNLYSNNEAYFSGYNSGFLEGYNQGENTGIEQGKELGYQNGYTEGEAQGYANALTEGVSQQGIFNGALSFIRVFFQLTTQLLDTKIIGDITFGLIIIGIPATALLMNLTAGFVKKLLGARGADE